jgi:hypothetical protein
VKAVPAPKDKELFFKDGGGKPVGERRYVDLGLLEQLLLDEPAKEAEDRAKKGMERKGKSTS